MPSKISLALSLSPPPTPNPTSPRSLPHSLSLSLSLFLSLSLSQLNYFWKSFSDHAANTHSAHEDMANLYPANQSLSVPVAKLNNAGSVFLDVPKEIDEVRKSIDASIAELLSKVEELMLLATKRGTARAEISHYQEKIVKLADDAKAGGDTKKQVKAESNQAKCVGGGVAKRL